ncbi:MAG: HTTM domain-containing protein [Rhodobacteraceae bacterium]|nr:HTTM domain-containing protein [Paracoccaceae bacterium]
MTATDVKAVRFRAMRQALARPVPAQSLAVFRMALGALLVIDCWRFIRHDRVFRYWVQPDFHFTYPGFGWVAPLPEPWIHLAWLAMGAFAALVMLGLFYRVAIVALTVSFGYFFLLDRAEYLNHFYLVILFLILMCFLPAQRVWSLDAWLRPRQGVRTVPHAAVFILRAQMEIMLVFAGLVKITPDWLAGEPLGLWLRAQADDFVFGWLFHHDAVILAGTWGTIALHLLGAPLLLWRRTRLAVFLVYCLFHSLNAMFFNIGIFPWLTIAATTIFFAPDWPGRLLARLGLPAGPAAVAPPAGPAAHLPRMALAAMAVWIAVQLFLPLRAGLFPTEVRWSGDGHELSWRMRIYDRVAEGRFILSVPGGETWVIDPEDFLTPRQVGKMLVRPDMIHQFAGHLEHLWRAAGHGEVIVRAEIRKSLNGRPAQLFVDPAADLTAVPFNHFGPDTWVRPLEIPVWGARDNRLAAAGRPSVDAGPAILPASRRWP